MENMVNILRKGEREIIECGSLTLDALQCGLVLSESCSMSVNVVQVIQTNLLFNRVSSSLGVSEIELVVNYG